MDKRATQKAGLPFKVHAHMLRHAAGYKLAGIDRLPRINASRLPHPRKIENPQIQLRRDML
jgi:hypothetical protein